VLVSVALTAVSAGLAGAAVIVSAGAGAGAGAAASVVVVEVAVESVFAASPLPLPQEATKRPIERANTLNLTNFIKMIFRWLCTFIPVSRKGNPRSLYIFL